MAPATISATPQHCLVLLPKLADADADIRYMSLNDLCNTLKAGSSTFLYHDYHTSAKVIDGIIATLDDQNGEVQNQAIKCVGALVLKLPADILSPFIHRVSNIKTTNSIDTSIHTTALRTILASFPPPVSGLPLSDKTNDAYLAISKTLIPRLLGSSGNAEKPGVPGMLELKSEKGVNGDAFDVLIDVIRGFGPILKDVEKQALMGAIMTTINDVPTSSVVKKKAVLAMSTIAVYLPDSLFKILVNQIPRDLQLQDLSPVRHRMLLAMIGALSKTVPQRLGPYLKILLPRITSVLSQANYEHTLSTLADEDDVDPEIDEIREAALVALEGLLSSCSSEMRAFTDEAVGAAVRYISYDPNSANDDDEDMESPQGSDNDVNGVDSADEDFEQEGAFSDDEDSSWKIRRCAAKALHAVVATRSSGDLLETGLLYEKIAPVLVKRFSEREENVRLEVMNVLALLVRKTGEEVASSALPLLEGTSPVEAQRSRKRRRLDSGADALEASQALSSTMGLSSPIGPPSPVIGPRLELAHLSPRIIKAAASVLKQPSISTRQAALSLLRDVVDVLHGGLSEALGSILKPLIDIIRSSTGSSSAAGGTAGTAASMRIEGLRLVGTICDSHSSKLLSPYVEGIVESTVSAVEDNYYKITGEALVTLESVIKVLTPPRSAANQKRAPLLNQVYQHVLGKTTMNDVDLEAREKAIHALGILLARTSKAQHNLISQEKRKQGLEALQERLKQETTRLAAIKAVDMILVSAAAQNDVSATWICEVAKELSEQLRKIDRNLRISSLLALKSLVHNPVCLEKLDETTSNLLATALLLPLSSQDLSLTAIAFATWSPIVSAQGNRMVTAQLIKALCEGLQSVLSGYAFASFLDLVQAIGQSGAGKDLMHAFLQDVGVSGDPAAVGKAIGTLLTSGGETVGVSLSDFESELKSSNDFRRQCLALSVLGEVGYRLGAKSTLKPKLFTDHFKSQSDLVPRAAAVALGRAGAGNMNAYLPVILANMAKGGSLQYLSLYSIKEILQSAGSNRAELGQHKDQIWKALTAASQAEDNKTLGAECIGRISVVDPSTFLPTLQANLKDLDASIRGMTIQAVRFTFTDSDDSLDDVLRPQLVNMLSMMLNDPNVENRRLALGTLNAAIIHKPEMILPHLSTLLPPVIKDSKPDPDLMREVQMGPFRHKVDDGLELRKSAYETLFSLLDHAYSRMKQADLLDRVVAGLEDEHEIKMICSLMITKLTTVDPDELLRRIDVITERLRIILSFKPRENSVKQEVEKATEASKSALMATIKLRAGLASLRDAASTDPRIQSWRNYWDWLQKEHHTLIVATEKEYRNQTA